MREIRIMDQTLRDAHQCLWASRMTTAMMLSVAERMDRMGFDGIDLIGGSHFDVCVRYLKEDPWERIRLMCRKVTRTPMYGMVRSRHLTGFDIVPNDLLLLWTERLIANGLRRFRAFDALNDLDAIVPLLLFAKKLGAYAIGALAYGHSPVHTDEHYVQRTRELIERTGVDAIMLKDAGGLLTPDRIRTLVPAMKKVIPATPVAPDPAVPTLRKKYPDMSDEERLLLYSYAGTQVDEMLAAGRMQTEYRFGNPVGRLIEEITKRPKLAHVYIQKKGLLLDLHKKPQAARG